MVLKKFFRLVCTYYVFPYPQSFAYSAGSPSHGFMHVVCIIRVLHTPLHKPGMRKRYRKLLHRIG